MVNTLVVLKWFNIESIPGARAISVQVNDIILKAINMDTIRISKLKSTSDNMKV